MTLELIVPKLQLFKHVSAQPICDLFAMSYLRGPADSSLDFAAIASEVLLLAGVAAEAVEEAEDNEKKEEIIQNFENKMLSLSQDVFR